ncbi:MAG: hypothetical protein R2684_01980 [Pyrinomonadaceae bacterium]
MWESASKHDLIMEVWEKLDCESVGRVEIEAILTVIEEVFGLTESDTPMRIARIVADEGAELRHSEIMELDVENKTARADLPIIGRPLVLLDLATALEEIDELEEYRSRLIERGDKDTITALRRKVIAERDALREMTKNQAKSAKARTEAEKMAECLTIWIESPEIYKAWKKARYPAHGSNEES